MEFKENFKIYYEKEANRKQSKDFEFLKSIWYG
jgi:hypothetical protein